MRLGPYFIPMPFTFEIVTGKMLDPNENVIGIGYSGFGAGVNNPALQDVPDVGPIPAGTYTITQPEDTVHSPFTLGLTPDPANEMFGRSGFLIHGDLVTAPGLRMASRGCIIMSRDVRETIWASSDHCLEVVSQLNQGVSQ
jgi:hypothetical protein